MDTEPQTLSLSLSPAIPTFRSQSLALYLHKLIVADEVYIGEDLVDGDGGDLLITCEGETDIRGGAGTTSAARVTCSGRQPSRGQVHSYRSCELLALWSFWTLGRHLPAELSRTTVQAGVWEGGGEGQVTAAPCTLALYLSAWEVVMTFAGNISPFQGPRW